MRARSRRTRRCASCTSSARSRSCRSTSCWVDGRFIARGDLRLVGHDTFHEYDGADHRDRERHRSDLRRDRDLEEHGWIRRGYTDLEVIHRPVTIIRDADRTLGRPHDPDRLAAWYALLRESCFTPARRHLLLRRLALID